MSRRAESRTTKEAMLESTLNGRVAFVLVEQQLYVPSARLSLSFTRAFALCSPVEETDERRRRGEK